MYLSWTDEHLTWNKSAYQDLDQIIMETTDVWMPTLQGMVKHFESNAIQFAVSKFLIPFTLI